MGFLSDALRLPSTKAIGNAAMVNVWDDGREQTPDSSYERNARQGYMLDELVYDCVEMRSTSAGEPPLCAYKKTATGDEKIDDHPALALLENPNPFMGRARFWQTISMCLDIGGNAYIEKVRSGAGKVVQLWILRPDRVKVIPDKQTFIGGYNYTLGTETDFLRAEDVIHFKTRHPLNDYYGLPPLTVLANRVDLDIHVRQFTAAFFRNAGVPAGLLNVVRSMSAQEKEDQRRRWREIYGGPEGWHKIALIDGGQATYTPMGLPMGASGLAMDELNQVNEARILGVYGVPPSLIPTLLGAGSSSYANRVSDRALFWEETMVPLFHDLDAALNVGLADEFPDLVRFEHDLSKVKALQDDEDKKFARWREAYLAGGPTWTEYRIHGLGLPEEPDTPGIVLVPTNMTPTWSDEMVTEPEPLEPPQPQEMLPPGQQPQLPNGQPAPANQPVAANNGRTNGTAH